MMQPGDIFYDSWGYDQTNIDFAQIVRLSPTGKTAYCRMMTQKIMEQKDAMLERVIPREPVGPEFRTKVDGDWLVGTYPLIGPGGRVEDLKFRKGFFSKWRGEPEYQSHDH